MPATTEAKRQKNAYYYRVKREMILAAKAKPCADCKVRYPAFVMDFDHVRGEKRAAIGTHGRFGLKALAEEIAKCDVVCANCHRIRTWTERT